MHAFFFGTSKAPLFGVYHPPRGTPRDHGVVLCYPYGQEYMRGHRAFRQLAFLLTRAGFHVLRFDWYGTGDSGGNNTDGSPERWVDDLDAAIDELQDMSDVGTISVIGARIGAALAARIAERRDDIENVVLWDPVVTGAEYLAEVLGSPGATRITSGNGDENAVVAAVNGFPFTRRMHMQLEALDVCGVNPAGKNVHVVVSHERAEYDRLRDALRHALQTKASYAHIPARGNWNEVDNFGSALLPQEVIQGIVKWLEGKA
jgi:uncharacterized protein